MKPRWCVWCIMVGLPPVLCGQAMVERALGTARAAGAASAGSSAGKSVGGIFDNVNRTLKKAGSPPQESVSKTPAAKRKESQEQPAAEREAARSTKTWEDPANITPGLELEELLLRFGEPAMRVTASQGAQTLYYVTRNGADVTVKIRDGKVSAVSGAGKAPQPEADNRPQDGDARANARPPIP